MMTTKTGQKCGCKAGQERDNCARCEGSGEVIDFAAIRSAPLAASVPATVPYEYLVTTMAEARKVPAHVLSGQAHRRGMVGAEPLIVILDSLTRYAAAHAERFESKLAEDYVLGPQWLAALVGARGLLDGDGAVAHEQGLSTDSKDNGACEAMFWEAMATAGFTEADL